METQKRTDDFSGGRIYTLGQNRTEDNNTKAVEIAGKGSKPERLSDLQAKAQKKKITQKIVLGLIDIAEQKNDKALIQNLWNTYHCQDEIVTHKKRTYGLYCKNRNCLVCLGIRKADLINKYYPVIKTWKDPKFVTITVRSVAAKRLPEIMKAMNRAFHLILDRNRKRHKRGKGIRLVGIRSLECNFNPKRRSYNPHFHVIVPNGEIAEQLVKDWMDLWTKKFTHRLGQDIRDVRNLEESLIEIIKYSTKVFTDPDPNNKNRKGITPKIYLKAMYNIFAAMKGQKVFSRFGFDLPKTDDVQSNVRKVTEYQSWIYDSAQSDWFNEETGQPFSRNTTEDNLQDMLDNMDNITE